MRYSLASRFRGTLLGATIAEKITHQNHTIHPPVTPLIIPGLQSLVELGEFAAETWIERLARLQLTPLQAIIATLPLALFVHDNKIKLRHNLLSVARMWPHEAVMQESLLAVGYTIAQALTEQLSPLKLIPQIINFIDTPKTDLVDKLQQVQTLLEQRLGADVSHKIPLNSDRFTSLISLSLYYFLSTPEDLTLSLNRSKRSPLAIGPIVGALSGAYNSAVNIPSSWQILTFPQTTSPETEMLKLSDYLVAVWSGAYHSEAKLITTAVAAPRVIRSR